MSVFISFAASSFSLRRPQTLLGSLLLGSLILAGSPLHAQRLAEPDRQRPANRLHQKDDQLDPRLAQQLSALMEEKENRTPAQKKIDSALLYTLKRRHNDPLFQKVPQFQTNLFVDNQGLVVVDIQGEVTDRLVQSVPGMGGEVYQVHASDKTMRAFMPIEKLEQLAALPEVRFIRPPVPFKTNFGNVTSEGDTTHRASFARSTFNVNGTGVKIGVLSDSYTTSDLVETGPVTVIPGQQGSGQNEGSAMLEIVKDLAPGATLYFATAFNGEASFAANIRALRDAGCSVIVDDVSYFDESPFQDGPVAQAVNDVALNSGVAYFSSAANNNNVDRNTPTGNNSSTWEGDFADSGVQFKLSNGTVVGTLHTFGADKSGGLYPTYQSRAFRFVNGSNQYLSQTHNLFWSDPLGGSTNDYDLYCVDQNANIIASSTNTQNGTQDPWEVLQFTPTSTATPLLMIVRHTGAATRALHLDGEGGISTYAYYFTSGATRGHNAPVNGFSIAAIDVHTTAPFPSAYTGGTANQTEKFSSDGPRRMFYNSNGTQITPGNLLFGTNGGTLFLKPDLAAADGVATSLPSPFNPFYGTSAAAPHAAAIAALVRSFRPNLTLAQIRSVLTSTALDVTVLNSMGGLVAGTTGWDRDSGYGIVMADTALGKLASTTVGVVSSLNPSLATQGVNLSATIAPVITPNTPTPTGTVTFSDNGTALGSASLVNGTATFPTSALGVGTHNITATYNGDANYPAGYAGLSNTVNQVVNSTLAIAGTGVNLSATGAMVIWTTTGGADSAVDYGTTPAYGSTLTNSTLVANHSIVLTGLAANTLYYYQVRSTGAGQTASRAGTFVTSQTSVARVNVAGYTFTRSGVDLFVDVTLQNPGTAPAQNVQITGATLGSKTSSGLPVAYPNIASNGTQTVVHALHFNSSDFPSGTATVLRINGTFTGGTFQLSFRVNVP